MNSEPEYFGNVFKDGEMMMFLAKYCVDMIFFNEL